MFLLVQNRRLIFFFAVWLSLFPLGSFASCAENLLAGRPIYGSTAKHLTLDDNTVQDLGLVTRIAPLFHPHLHTFAGIAHLNWLITHPLSEASEIRHRQVAARVLQNSPERRAVVNEQLRKIGAIVGTTESCTWLPAFNKLNKLNLLPTFGVAALCRLPWWGVASFVSEQAYFRATLLGIIGLFTTGVNFTWGEETRAYFEKSFAQLFQEMLGLADALSGTESLFLDRLAGTLRLLTNPAEAPELNNTHLRLKNLWPTVSAWNVLRYPVELATQRSIFTFSNIESSLAKSRDQILQLMSVIAEVDVLNSTSSLASTSPLYRFPTVLDSAHATLRISEGHHPYLLARKPQLSTGNSLRLETRRFASNYSGGARVALVLGPNMGGKSTYLRMAGILSVMAQIAAPVPGELTLTPLHPITRMRITDDEEAGESTFSMDAGRMVELDQAMTRPNLPGEVPMLALVDELARGTSAREADAIETGLLERWSETGNLIVVSSHNDHLPQVLGNQPTFGVSHVAVELDADGNLHFPHKVLPGLPGVRSALAILKAKGLPDDALVRIRRHLP